MNKQINLTGWLLILAAVTFWISWFLMPDPGTTDARHILEIVKQSRIAVLLSVIIQIISSVLFLVALFFVIKIAALQKSAMIGIVLLGIGAMGLCADAFFHLLAWFMTDDSVTIQEDVIRVMGFMQAEGLVFLVPLLLPFFIGSLVLAIGLNKQAIISAKPKLIFVIAFLTGLIGTIIANMIGDSKIPGFMLTVLGLFAAGQIFMGIEFIKAVQKKKTIAAPLLS
ncbi:MAG TPA: hypothetical protein VF487_02710 [Chitinophagaceae bacterium]